MLKWLNKRLAIWKEYKKIWSDAKVRMDILLPTAYQGGVENVINMTACYLQKQDIDIRIIQIVGDGKWCHENIPIHIVSSEAGVFSVDQICDAYVDFIEKSGTPDIALCAVWPVMCIAARKALEKYNQNRKQEKQISFKIGSWIHHGSVYYVEAAGWGGYKELQSADFHLAINMHLVEEMKQSISDAKVFRINNPVNMKKYEKTRKEFIEKKNRKLQIIYVGRISREKRLDVIINGLEYAKETCELHMVGSTPGEYEQAIRRMIEEKNLSEIVHWYSWKENPWEDASKMDVCVMASDVEGFPLVAIEALANGLPILATPAEGMEELIQDGINGYLYPFEDYITLGKLLKAMSLQLLPEMNPVKCQDSVKKFDHQIALEDFREKILQATNN